MTTPPDPGAADRRRRDELAANVAQARAEMAAACRRVGRDSTEVELVAVTKTFPAADVVRLAELGVTEVGENRDQEAVRKAEEVAGAGVKVRWHFVGQLQRNKCRSVVRYAGMVQSVDRPALARALDVAARQQRDDPLPVLLQLSLDGDVSRGGVAAADDAALVDAVLACEGLRLEGVMTVAPMKWESRRAFETLAARAAQVQQTAPDATTVSAGMSGDFAEAIAYGASSIRLGAKLLGRRDDVGYADETEEVHRCNLATRGREGAGVDGRDA